MNSYSSNEVLFEGIRLRCVDTIMLKGIPIVQKVRAKVPWHWDWFRSYIDKFALGVWYLDTRQYLFTCVSRHLSAGIYLGLGPP